MTEVSHLLAPAGWKLIKNAGTAICAKFLPEEGASLLIGGPASSQKTRSVVWFDKNGKLRIIEKLVRKGPYWEGTLKDGKKSYIVTAWKTKSPNGKSRIAGDIEAGDIEAGDKSRLAALAAKWTPGTEFEAQGTWGAEANPGGGGGGTGTRPG